VDHLCADPSKVSKELGWEPTVGFDELVSMMVEADLELLSGPEGQHDESFGPEGW
jgi:GDPmannose 4,6-dehydratase